jgi:hypothetical protein
MDDPTVDEVLGPVRELVMVATTLRDIGPEAFTGIAEIAALRAKNPARYRSAQRSFSVRLHFLDKADSDPR